MNKFLGSLIIALSLTCLAPSAQAILILPQTAKYSFSLSDSTVPLSVTGTITTNGGTGGLSSLVTAFNFTGSINSTDFSVVGTSATTNGSDVFLATTTAILPNTFIDSILSYDTTFLGSDGSTFTVIYDTTKKQPKVSVEDIELGVPLDISMGVQLRGSIHSERLTVPEPTTLPLIMLGLAALLMVRGGGQGKKGNASQTVESSRIPALSA